MGAIFHAQSENWIPQSHHVMRRNPYPDQNRIPHSHYAAYRSLNPNWIPQSQSHDVKCQSQNLCCGSRRRKRSPAGMNPPNSRNHSRANLRPEGASDLGPGSPAKNLVMGQVKILKRGEQLPSPSGDYWNAEEMLVLCSTQRLGPEPETVHKELSAFLVSPLPSSLPIPKFFGTKVKNTGAATCHLR
nr:Cortactin-binding protein like [Ipomoea batatas]